MASVGNPGNATIVLKRAPLVKDARSGQFIRDWANAERFTIPGCSVQAFPLAEKLNYEVNDNREFARSSIRVYASADSVVPEPTDRVEYRGREYELFGYAAEWLDLEENLDHIAYVCRIRGG
ncbi:hypothetical protein ACWGDD_36095 [Streptomyces sp. NPDC055011]|uniref:hypothetical protein n=1 Tax=Micromonospora sp. CB01531 TaxID=1718947 RepID=UPI000B121D85|nr:hypothetical protein [Micromonospora sp. CB01531]